MIRVLSGSEKITRGIAKKLAEKIPKTSKHGNALVLGLSGNLGAGKTTFIKGFIGGFGYAGRITSPTFLIFKRFGIKKGQFNNIYHVDAYRIKKVSEFDVLGFEEIVSNPKNIVLVEWAEKIKKLLPKDTIWLRFGYGRKENQRVITIKK